MKGISFITDEKNNKTAVIIDLKTFESKNEEVHEYLDVLIAESRKNEPVIDWETAKKQLKKSGKL
jgi:PHD/YefM family antitoxin component YafN of YafNO toxin-antitoxin module